MTQTNPPAMAMPWGRWPMRIVAVARLVRGSIRATDPRAERLLEALLIDEGYLSGGLRA